MNIKLYFLEIRNRLFLLILSWLSVVVVCYIFKEILFFGIVKQSMNLKFCHKELPYFIFTDVSEIFYVYIVLIFFVSNQALFLCFFYHIFVFMLPGFYCYEALYFTFIFKVSLSLFVFSVFVFHKFLFPLSWNFFLSFQTFDVLKLTTLYFESKINEYFSFYMSLYYICLFYFQIWIILFIVFDFLNTKKLISVKSFRKFFYYVFVIFSTLITPPDVVSQLCISLFFIFSYEILVFYFIFETIKGQSLIR